jgi:hypothetical protein
VSDGAPGVFIPVGKGEREALGEMHNNFLRYLLDKYKPDDVDDVNIDKVFADADLDLKQTDKLRKENTPMAVTVGFDAPKVVANVLAPGLIKRKAKL